MHPTIRKTILFSFAILAILSVYFAAHLKFTFDFEQFFPQGDPDLEFFKDFIEEFETDDNFMLVALERKEGVFHQPFLEAVHDFSLKTRELPHLTDARSLTQISYPLKTPFAITSVPAIHIDDPSRYEADKARILSDERFVYNLINPEATALIVAMKNTNSIQLKESEEFMAALEDLIQTYDFENHYMLGRPYFTKELVAMQKREIIVSALVSSLLVLLILFLIFRRPIGIAVAIVSIGLGMIIFLGLLGAWGRELNAMAALYPVLMIIVGTSDVIHIMSKYIDELRKGTSKKEAINITIKEIGMATLLTSVTTAIGFATLLTSRIGPIKDFGMNAAIGVLVAYITVLCFTTALLSFFKTDQIIKLKSGESFWDKKMDAFYRFTLNNTKGIAIGGLAVLILCGLGIAQITTNYRIESNMPRGAKLTEDFLFFENNMAGFRPMEIAVFAQEGYAADGYEVLKTMDSLEQHLRTYGNIKSINSMTTIYKSIGQMNAANQSAGYKFPATEKKFFQFKKMVDKLPEMGGDVLISKDGRKARIASRILDNGADSIKLVGAKIDAWISENTDPSIVTFKRTGTGLILDKNAEYVRTSLLQGLGVAVLIVSLLMALLFRNLKMLFISLVPNVFPLLMAGAMLGYIGIELEAGISIVFAVVFGIAVDDTIHFLSKFKLSRLKGLSIEESLHITFLETGKPIALTSIILFFGFLVMLFSVHPPSVVIGSLISLTLASALFGDLLFIPLLIRWLMKEDEI